MNLKIGLIFAIILIMMKNNLFNRKKFWLSRIILLVAFIFLLCLGKTYKIGAEENYFPTFGSGPIQVRLYTDYFCPPCRDMEPGIEPLLIDLVKDGTIQLTFIDVPTSRHTVLYANYFLFSLGAKKDIDSAIKARRVLFEAAEKKITEGGKLVGFLKERGVAFKAVDPYPVFNFWNNYMQDDKIQSTPSCVIINGDKKETYRGNIEVPKAIEKLKNKSTTKLE
ncbi:MAG: DsbA family protein [Thermodesulfobacteriota bacterium]